MHNATLKIEVFLFKENLPTRISGDPNNKKTSSCNYLQLLLKESGRWRISFYNLLHSHSFHISGGASLSSINCITVSICHVCHSLFVRALRHVPQGIYRDSRSAGGKSPLDPQGWIPRRVF